MELDMDTMFLLTDAIALGGGLYCAYTFYQLITKNELFANGILVPKDRNPKDCKNAAEYIAYIKPRLLIMTIVTILYGALLLVNDLWDLNLTPFPYNYIPLGICLAVLIWFAVCITKAYKKYF